MKKLFQRIDASSNKDASHGSYLGKIFTVGQKTVTVEEIIAEGGFALVFLVKASGGGRYALKRMYVNNEHDLEVARNEINIAKMLHGPRTVVGYVDSSVTHTGGGVYEVLLLMTYCRKHLLHLMNDRSMIAFALQNALKVFCLFMNKFRQCWTATPPVKLFWKDFSLGRINMISNCRFLLFYNSVHHKPTQKIVCPLVMAAGRAAEHRAGYTIYGHKVAQ
ncbi:unnamed protein product, partial [Meganyctiphanes norvegica]